MCALNNTTKQRPRRPVSYDGPGLPPRPIVMCALNNTTKQRPRRPPRPVYVSPRRPGVAAPRLFAGRHRGRHPRLEAPLTPRLVRRSGVAAAPPWLDEAAPRLRLAPTTRSCRAPTTRYVCFGVTVQYNYPAGSILSTV